MEVNRPSLRHDLRVDNRTEQLADGVWRIELAFWVSAFVLANNGHDDTDGLTLVDTGTNGMAPRLVRSIRLAGLNPSAVGDVLLTHWHTDHAGGAQRFAASSSGPRVWIGTEDLPVLTGELTPGDAAVDCGRLTRLLHRYAYAAPSPCASAQPLLDGMELEAAGGTVVTHTPGHTAGHLALHLPSRGVLIAGDAVMNLWRLSASPRALCSAQSQAAASIQLLSELSFDVLAPMHGPPITKQAQARLAAVAARLN